MDTTKMKKLTVKFAQNWNYKLYGKYFTSIRAFGYGLIKDDIVEIVLKDNAIAVAKVIEVRQMYFHELDHLFVQCDTGVNYSDSLELFFKFGINVKSFETKVDVIFFETQYYIKKPTA